MAFKGAILISGEDNAATCLEDIEAGSAVEVRSGDTVFKVTALEKIPAGFKIAVSDITRGSQILKYGQPIGIASADIKKGNQVHVHNLEGGRGRGDLARKG